MANKYVVSIEVNGITYFVRGSGMRWLTPNVTEAKFFFRKRATEFAELVREEFLDDVKNPTAYPPRVFLKIRGAYNTDKPTVLTEVEIQTIRERELVISYL